MVPVSYIIWFLLLNLLEYLNKPFSSFNPLILILFNNKSELWQIAQEIFGIHLI